MDHLQKVMSTEKFGIEIDRLASTLKIDYMDAVIHYCEKNNLEIEAAASLIRNNQRIKARLRSEAEDLNFLPKRAKLPL